MEGRGGCCIARYAASGHGVYDMSKVHRIMLRFRPIAPKPTTGGSVSPQGSSEICSKSGRGKRRLSSKESNTKRCNKKRRVLNEEKRVTLPLIPESPDCKESVLNQQKGVVVPKSMPFWLSFGDKKESFLGGGGPAEQMVVVPSQKVRSGSCVTVECVTDTWVSADVLGSTDEEKKDNLRRDTCPGFISDRMGRVTWTNGAYKQMVGAGGETTVWLAMKERLPVMITYPAFTCKVRVQYACGKELTLPCDVWVMNGGGFAWRLDINAALCLGR
ncbi:Dynamic Influencer of Gene expression 2, ABA-induced transcription repressor 5 [Hibiscus trionum]|uniref:Dynamic Influencer of Gene expression 2, ABA-induced transcription repressor 5 n=1 Tax=Hibiscus trionum TaxID=183268 RepID=A0A9W7JH98_HIBTR|nr:Dynamic Influencer of Gene expression 2, ABA-induced transcription repressor 5 [Hibiscus trionum]